VNHEDVNVLSDDNDLLGKNSISKSLFQRVKWFSAAIASLKL
jgi:hypothetical protein